MDLCTTELIFHKGLEEEFRNMIWDVKYRKGEFTSEKLKVVVQELNKNQDGEVIIKADNQVYWRRHFPEFKKNYLRDYPRCRELSDYKQELLQQSQLVLSSTILGKRSQEHVSESETESYFDDDSDYSRQQSMAESSVTAAARKTPNKRLKRRIEKFLNDSDHDDINISNSHMMLDDNYFIQKPVEVIEMTDEHRLNEESANI